MSNKGNEDQMLSKVKEWYRETYPTDDLGKEINNEVTFENVFVGLDDYQDIYDIIGVGDSVIRERVFKKLAEIMNVDYDYIYQQWLMG